MPGVSECWYASMSALGSSDMAPPKTRKDSVQLQDLSALAFLPAMRPMAKQSPMAVPLRG